MNRSTTRLTSASPRSNSVAIASASSARFKTSARSSRLEGSNQFLPFGLQLFELFDPMLPLRADAVELLHERLAFCAGTLDLTADFLDALLALVGDGLGQIGPPFHELPLVLEELELSTKHLVVRLEIELRHLSLSFRSLALDSGSEALHDISQKQFLAPAVRSRGDSGGDLPCDIPVLENGLAQSSGICGFVQRHPHLDPGFVGGARFLHTRYEALVLIVLPLGVLPFSPIRHRSLLRRRRIAPRLECPGRDRLVRVAARRS